MDAVTNLDRLDYFVDQKTIVSIFLASKLEKTPIEWLFFAWEDLDRITGHSWHLLVPTIEPIHDLKHAKSENFNSSIARKLIEQYQIPDREMPCIVFDDFNDDHAQHYVSLTGRSEVELRDFFLDCAKIIERRREEVYATSLGIWRTKVIGEIFNISQAKKYGKGFMKIAPLFGSATRLIGLAS